MRTSFGLAILLLPLLACAGFYKWVGPDGRVQYSDRPLSGAERVSVQVDRGEDSSPVQVSVAGDVADPGPYESLEIVNPEPNQTLRNADGKVGLSLLIDPPLSADHRLQILLDGQPVPGYNRQTQLLLQGLPFGSHRVQARIQDDLDATIATSPSIDFHLRKPLPEGTLP